MKHIAYDISHSPISFPYHWWYPKAIKVIMKFMDRLSSQELVPRWSGRGSNWIMLGSHSQLGVSINGGTAKWMVYKGTSYWNGWCLLMPGGTPISGNLQLRWHLTNHGYLVHCRTLAKAQRDVSLRSSTQWRQSLWSREIRVQYTLRRFPSLN